MQKGDPGCLTSTAILGEVVGGGRKGEEGGGCGEGGEKKGRYVDMEEEVKEEGRGGGRDEGGRERKGKRGRKGRGGKRRRSERKGER